MVVVLASDLHARGMHGAYFFVYQQIPDSDAARQAERDVKQLYRPSHAVALMGDRC